MRTGSGRLLTAATGVACGALLLAAGTGGPVVVAVAVVVVAVAMAPGWTELLHLPTPRGSTAVIASCGAVAAAVVALTETEPYLRWLPGVLAACVLVEFWHQLLRRDMRPRLVESVTGVVAAVVVVVFGAGWVAVLRIPGGWALLVLGTVTLAAASAATALPWPQRLLAPFTLAVGAAAGVGVAGVVPGLAAVPAAVLGSGVALLTSSTDRLLESLPSAHAVPAAVARGAAPAAAAGTVVYLLGRVLLG